MTSLGSSFRDPEGRIYVASGRVFRGISQLSTNRVRDFIESAYFKERAGTQIVNSWIVSPEDVLKSGVEEDDVNAWTMWLEHECLPLISYPYEWSFENLKQAACFTLSLLADALKNGYTLKDASAFNVQFVHSKPIFIDILSFVDYSDGDPFIGYKQFCEHFISPLCLTAFADIEYNHWFRGRLDGLDVVETSKALPLSTYFRLQVLMHIHIQAWGIKKITSTSKSASSFRSHRRIPQRNLLALVKNLNQFIARLKRKRESYWQAYSENTSYDFIDEEAKKHIAKKFIEQSGARKLLDLGCNTGEYSRMAIESGVKTVVGVDLDSGALDLAVKNTRSDSASAHFLFWDLANPSSKIGWKLEERDALETRIGRIDAVFCFALIHHVVIGRNIPLDEFVNWVCSLAPRGLIEFVPKSDPMTRGLLENREDVFHDYDEMRFEQWLAKYTTSITVHKLHHSGRLIFEFEKKLD